ncbi:MAG: M3 family oligoendopeptidase [Acidimicrobiia bacterium]
MVDVAPALPTWDLSTWFDGLDSPRFAAAHEAVGAGITRLVALYDRHDVRGTADGSTRPVDAAAVAAVDEVLAETNALLAELHVVDAYVYSFVSTDARDDLAAGLDSQLRSMQVPLAPLRSRLDAWLASFGAEPLVAASPLAADHAHLVRRAETGARHQMTEAEEVLAAQLDVTGGSAWTQLHGDVSSRLTATVDGEELPITAVRNLAFDPDPGRRRRAYDAELAAWDTVAVTLAACMNGVKGQTRALNERRGWEDALAPALFGNAVERPVLEAMQRAAEASFPDFRRYLGAKARLLGHGDGVLPWWDLFAPVGDPAASAVSWSEATVTVDEAFGSFAPGLRALSERAVGERWIDVGPRDGKRGGAFCMSVDAGESRVLLNFGGTIDGVSTLAHELGHAYHNTQLADRTMLQRRTPMALAETASIFCETLLFQHLLADADPDRRLVLLENDLQGACQVVVDIHSRFLFERAVFERCGDRSLPVAELRELMSWAQRETYGDALDPAALHPDMWAVKPHYYGSSFYNWPYTFGLLFGVGLYARYLDDPDRFRTGYDDLLSATGLATAAELAARFEIDVADEGFWTASLDVIRGRIDELVGLADAAAPSS